MNPLDHVTQTAVKAGVLPEPQVCRSPEAYWVCRPDAGNTWVSLTTEDARRHLRGLGYSAKVTGNSRLSEVDAILDRATVENRVDSVCYLAGYPPGIYRENDAPQHGGFLVPSAPRYLEPIADRDWSWLRRTIEEMLGPEQSLRLYGWLQHGIRSLRAGPGNFTPGHALVLAGSSGCGKSFLQKKLAYFFGGPRRVGSPYRYMTGADSFNGDLAECEYLTIDDEAAQMSYADRTKFGIRLKQITSAGSHRIRPIYGKAFTASPFWRLSISLNDDGESMQVLPPRIESVWDRILLFKCSDPWWVTEARGRSVSEEQWAERDRIVEEEAPGMLHWLLNEFVVPADIQCGRMGVRPYVHPCLEATSSQDGVEFELLDLIDHYLFPPGISDPVCGRGSEIEMRLREADTSRKVGSLLYFSGAMGTFLGRLKNKVPHRVSSSKHRGRTVWTIRRGDT